MENFVYTRKCRVLTGFQTELSGKYFPCSSFTTVPCIVGQSERTPTYLEAKCQFIYYTYFSKLGQVSCVSVNLLCIECAKGDHNLMF